ncbi:MAG: hypothetical protein OXT74_06145 [Candidatus Poribacteria bacterium]|nr:hypothetical protein [Candidatus Poribacteria bacterium]
MSDDSQSSFRELTVGGIFRESLVLYHETWRQLLGIAAPCSIISAVIYFFLVVQQSNSAPTPSGPTTGPAMLLFVAFVIFLSYVGVALGTIIISERISGGVSSIGKALLRIADVFFPLLGTLVFVSIAITAGLFTLAIPGLVVYGWFCLAPAVVMIEGEGGIGALKRSYVIVKGYWNKAFFVVVLLAILQLVVASLIYSLSKMLGAFAGITEVSEFLSILLPLLIIEPVKIITTNLLYYDLRIRKEGYTIQNMADEIGALS